MTTIVQAGKRIIERFDGKDYAIWALHMKNLLREKKLVKYIEGTVTDGYSKEQDEQALAEIQFTMDNTQIKLIMHCKSALDAWIKLRARYQSTMMSNKLSLRAEFLSMSYRAGESVREYESRVTEMAENLSSLSIDVTDEDKTIVLTKSLPEAYDSVIEALHQGDKFGDYTHVSNTLLNAEDRIKKRHEGAHDENALTARTRGRGNSSRANGRSRSVTQATRGRDQANQVTCY